MKKYIILSMSLFFIASGIFCGELFCAKSVGSELVGGESEKSFVLSNAQTKKIKGMSKDALKERLGESTRDAFHNTTELSKGVGSLQMMFARKKKLEEDSEEKAVFDASLLQASLKVHEKVGSFQVELATLQKRFSHIIENLVDNQAPFKKAGKGSLQGAYKVMMQVDQDLKKQVDGCSNLVKQMKQEKASSRLSVMKRIDQSCESYNSFLKQLHVTLDRHECLKKT